MPRPIHPVLLNIILGIGGALAALLALEAGVRSLDIPAYKNGNEALVCSDQLGWRGAAHYRAVVATDGYEHAVAHNSAGMHDGEHPLEKPANTFRLLMLGDSFVRAAHVNESEAAHQVLENLLNDGNPAKDFEVISAGVTGWGTAQQLLYYRTEGRFYRPDLVLLMFYIGNDLQDNLPGKALTIDGRNCYAPYFVICEDRFDSEPWFYSPGLKPVMGQCPSGRKMLANTLGRLYFSSRLYARIEPLLAASQNRFDKLPYYPPYIPEKNALFDYAWELTIALIGQLAQEVREEEAEFAVVLISPADVINLLQMNSTEREAIYQKIPDLRKAQPDLPHARLTQTLAPQGIDVLDLQPLFLQYTQQTGETLYFPQDKHWNVKGNWFAAEAIYNWLSRAGGLTSGPGQQNVTLQ